MLRHLLSIWKNSIKKLSNWFEVIKSFKFQPFSWFSMKWNFMPQFRICFCLHFFSFYFLFSIVLLIALFDRNVSDDMSTKFITTSCPVLAFLHVTRLSWNETFEWLDCCVNRGTTHVCNNAQKMDVHIPRVVPSLIMRPHKSQHSTSQHNI